MFRKSQPCDASVLLLFVWVGLRTGARSGVHAEAGVITVRYEARRRRQSVARPRPYQLCISSSRPSSINNALVVRLGLDYPDKHTLRKPFTLPHGSPGITSCWPKKKINVSSHGRQAMQQR